jgi:hypothetical protein
MLDPLTALSVAGNVVQFVEYGTGSYKKRIGFTSRKGERCQ